MISTTPVERIARLLGDTKYARLPVPLKILKLSFDIGAAFIGSETSSDLVVVIDNVDRPELRMVQIVEALSRALDVARSRRSLTVIVVGPRPVLSTIERLSRVARVLPVGVITDEEALRDWLAVLLPLTIPAVAEPPGPVLQDASNEIEPTDVLTTSFEQAALLGEDKVQELLIRLVESPFKSGEEASELEVE
jgi:hypothetical protein